MKITIELGNEDINAERLQAINTLLIGTPGVTYYEYNGGDAPKEEPEEETAETPYDPDARIYGENGEKSRRTKEEMARDKAIEERWAALWPSKPNPPAKPVAELEAHLDDVEAAQNDEGGFEVDDDTPMDIDEFRAVLNKSIKALGGKKVAEIMSPHKSATDVPEDQRREYAGTLSNEMDG